MIPPFFLLFSTNFRLIEFIVANADKMIYNEHMFEKGFIKKNITWITAGAILMFALVLYLLSQLFADGSDCIVVLVDGQERGTYSLHEDRKVRIETPQGYNYLIIGDGHAYVSEADCDNQVCVHTQPVSETGGQIICLPHRVVIRLKLTEKSEIDAFTN